MFKPFSLIVHILCDLGWSQLGQSPPMVQIENGLPQILLISLDHVLFKSDNIRIDDMLGRLLSGALVLIFLLLVLLV